MISFCQDIHISYEYHYQVQTPNVIKKPSKSTQAQINSAANLQKAKKFKIEVLSKRQNSHRSQCDKPFIGIQISNPNKNICRQDDFCQQYFSRQMKSQKTLNNKGQLPVNSGNIVFHSPTTSKNIQSIRAKHKRTGSHQVGATYQQNPFNFSKISSKKTYNFFNEPTINTPQPTNRQPYNQSTQLMDLQKSNQTKVFKKAIRPLQLTKKNKQILKTVQIESNYGDMNELETPGKNKKEIKLRNINEISSINNRQTLKLPIQKNNFKNNNFRNSILNDAVSIVSKNFQEQSFSMVQPGQYFFYESQILNRQSNFSLVGKRQLHKTFSIAIALQSSINFICALKQYPKQYQKCFLAQFQTYCYLIKQNKGDPVQQILNIYQILPNSKDKKLLMVKEPYTNTLQDYIKLNHIQKREIFVSRIIDQARKCIIKLQSFGLYIKEQDTFQIQDFVQRFNEIKLQNLSKFQRTGANMSALKADQRIKVSQIKLDILQLKIKREMPFSLKI